MGEDSEINVKKRRKITSVSSVPAEIAKPVHVDVYQRVVDFEEAEARQRSAEKDALLFHKFCEDIRQLLTEISELKTKNSPEAREEISSKRIQATLMLVALKKLNRLEKVRTKAGRDALHKEKQRLDSTHLLLQNLLYETEHLDKEVTKCLQFKSKDEEIDLVPVEEFYRDAPEEVSRPEVTKKDGHQLRLARLEWELRQRRKLSEACNQLRESAQAVSSSLTASRARLDSLGPCLKDALTAAEPLKEALGLTGTVSAGGGARGIASLLPPPLFLLHARVQAYTEAFGHHLVQVGISGDEDEAHRLEQERDSQNVFQDSDSDQDPKEEEDNQEKKKRHHRSGTKVTKQERAEEKLKLVIKSHPLVIKLTIKFKEASLTLTFSYLINLKIITIQSSIEIPKPSGVSSADVLNSQSILNGLYAGDFGADSPHPATGYILRSAGVEKKFSEFIPQLGYPYIWAQRMCGLDFLASSYIDGDKPGSLVKIQNEPCPNLSSISVENVLIVLKKRLKARISLMKELQDLESGNIPPFEGTGSSQVRLLGSLTQWQSISWAEYSQAVSVGELINLGLVAQHDMFYRAIITRQSAKLIALVSLKSDYPKRAPIFSLTLHWNGAHHAGTDDDIRDIERCVNTDWCISEGTNPKVSLAGQLTRLLCCLDILLEAVGSSEFPPDKVMFRPVKGRNRIKPYKYLKQGSGVFTQF